MRVREFGPKSRCGYLGFFRSCSLQLRKHDITVQLGSIGAALPRNGRQLDLSNAIRWRRRATRGGIKVAVTRKRKRGNDTEVGKDDLFGLAHRIVFFFQR